MPGFEVRAQSDKLETWALLWVEPPWKPGQDVKVVWRTTGQGAFDVVAVGPAGQRVPPHTGPTEHTWSDWNRPGEEWGTFFRLPDPGEWVFQVRRGVDTALLTVRVAA